jgi:phage baseplate assembly protein W
MIVITSALAKQTSQMVLPGKQYGTLNLQATVTETNPLLTAVGASIDWNDGTPPVAFAPALPLNINVSRNLFIGTYFITLSAHNFLSPAPQSAAAYFNVEILPEQVVPTPQLFLFGPILPMDDGFPNASQWNFATGNDIQVLKSSVKMLLITAKGERVMQPTYGTSLRRIVFEPNTSSISTVIRQEIDEALIQFEPRVVLDSFDVQRLSNRDVMVKAQFLSKINQNSFSLALGFSQ